MATAPAKQQLPAATAPTRLLPFSCSCSSALTPRVRLRACTHVCGLSSHTGCTRAAVAVWLCGCVAVCVHVCICIDAWGITSCHHIMSSHHVITSCHGCPPLPPLHLNSTARRPHLPRHARTHTHTHTEKRVEWRPPSPSPSPSPSLPRCNVPVGARCGDASAAAGMHVRVDTRVRVAAVIHMLQQ